MSSRTKNSTLSENIALCENQPLSDLKSRSSRRKGIVSGVPDVRELMSSFFKGSYAAPSKGMNLVSCALERLGCVRSDVIEPPRAIGSAGRDEMQKIKDNKGMRKKRRDLTAKNRRVINNNTRMSPFIVDVCCVPGMVFPSDAYLVDCVVPSRSRVKQTENVVFQFSPLFEESFSGQDQYSDWRLNIDDMSYEELLDLSDKIGYESTGLKTDEMLPCLIKAGHHMQESIPLLLDIGETWICSICQEGDEAVGEKGRLDCGHTYHIECIKLWLKQRNSCPECKCAAITDK